jgi:ABC-type transport system involved in multi-copper enzyme maturation permease subunit
MNTESLRRDGWLLRRDAILHWRSMLPAVLFFTAFQGYFVMVVNQPKMWLVLACVYATFLTAIPINRDDKMGTVAWSCTLPVTRADVVRGRYLTAWALVVSLFAVNFALAAFLPGSRLDLPDYLAPDRLLLVAGVCTFILAWLIPFTIQFGFMGVMLMLVVLQIAGALLFVVAKLTGGQNTVEGGIASFFGGLSDGLVALRETLSAPLFQLAMLAAMLLVNWVSYRISVALFRRREL